MKHTDEDGAAIFKQACAMGLEGIVSKRLSAPYRSGPSRDWLKIKNPDSPAMVRAREGSGDCPTDRFNPAASQNSDQSKSLTARREQSNPMLRQPQRPVRP